MTDDLDKMRQQAKEAGIRELKPRMKRDADTFVAEAFSKINEYVKEDLAVILSQAGLNQNETLFAFLRMVSQRLVSWGFESAWGKTEKERTLAHDFFRVCLGHVQKHVSEVVGLPCKIVVIWGTEETEIETPEE